MYSLNFEFERKDTINMNSLYEYRTIADPYGEAKVNQNGFEGVPSFSVPTESFFRFMNLYIPSARPG